MPAPRPRPTSAARVYGYDAYASGVSLAAFLLAWGAINLTFAQALPWPTTGVRLFQMALAAVALVYFVATWRRPRVEVAMGFALIEIVSSLILVPWVGWIWMDLERPWNVFIGVHVILVSMPLVVPHSLRLGIALIALFAAEAVGLAIYGRQTELSLPVEPFPSLAFAAGALVYLVIREQRRCMAAKHVLVEGEEAALQRLRPVLASVRAELGAQLTQLCEAIQALGGGATYGPTDRAVSRISAVEQQLEGVSRRARAKEPPGALSDNERRLIAADVHLGATAFAAAIVIGTAAVPTIAATTETRAGAAIAAALGLLALGFLHLTRQRPSARRAFAISVALFFVALALVTMTHLEPSVWGHLRQPFQPLVGHKLLLMGVALMAPRRLWVGCALVLATLGNALLFYWVGFIEGRISVLEPWATLLVAAMAVGYLVIRDQGRLMSIGLLRAATETSSLRRRATLLFSLRDQLNSPLQTLVLHIARLQLVDPRSPPLMRIDATITRLIALSRELAHLQDELPPDTLVSSMDAARELASDVPTARRTAAGSPA